MKGGAIEFLTECFVTRTFSTPFTSVSLAIILA